MRPFLAVLLTSAALAGCTLAPTYNRPAPPVPQAYPTEGGNTDRATAAELAWRDVVTDPRLQQVVQLALEQNRDLRVAVGNIEQARARYRIQRADLLPGINAVGSQSQGRTPRSVSGTGTAIDGEQYSATVGFAAFELDLFGRVRSLSNAALQSFFATEETRRSVQVSLIYETVVTYLTLAADQDQLALARATVQGREASLDLAQKRFDAGATSALDLAQVQTLTEQARSDLAAAIAFVEQDRNALRLVVGADIPADLLPNGDLTGVQIRADLPPGLPAEVLVRRPDVLAAEHNLRAQNANIGAARAAFLPRISLTGSTGSASPELDGLFNAGTGAWSFAPQIVLPLFNGGANLANLRGARAGKDIAIAQYERAIQVAFREVADALAVQSTIRDRVAAQERLVAAAAQTERLSRARYDRGVDSYLTLLDAQRTLYAAQQSLLSVRLAEAANRVALYRALGGGVR